MAGYHLQLRRVLAQDLRRPQGHIAVRGAVEAVAADLVLLVILIGDGVQIGVLRHGLVEGSVEHRCLGHVVAQHRPAGLDADDVGGVMQRRQGGAVLHRLHHLIGNQDGVGKAFAAVDHPVTHRVDLLHGGDDAVDRVHQSGQHRLDGLGMGGHGHVGGHGGRLALYLGLIGKFSVNADALAQAFGQQMAGFRVQQLIFQRRAAGIDDKYFHERPPRILVPHHMLQVPSFFITQDIVSKFPGLGNGFWKFMEIKLQNSGQSFNNVRHGKRLYLHSAQICEKTGKQGKLLVRIFTEFSLYRREMSRKCAWGGCPS